MKDRPSKEELIRYELLLLKVANEQVRNGKMSLERYSEIVQAHLRFIRTQIHDRT